MKEKTVKVCLKIGEKPHFYNGIFLKENENFLWIKDRILGEIQINKKEIVTLNEVQK